MARSSRTFPDLLTVAAIGIVAYVVALTLHEVAGHLVPAVLLGGSPELVTTTDVRGDWSALSAGELRLVAAGGSVVNLAVAALCGIRLTSPARLDGRHRYFLWLLAAVSAYIPGTYLIASPILGFGDWATFVRELEPGWLWRALLVVAGLGLCLLATGALLRGLEPFLGRRQPARDARARVLTRLPYLAGGLVACAAAVPSPLGLDWSMAIAAGSSLGTTWWLFGMRSWIPAAPSEDELSPPPVQIVRSRAWLLAGILAAVVFIGVLGPGIVLS